MRPWLLLAPEYPPARGGVADYTRQLAQALTGAGHEVDVWAPEGPFEAHPSVVRAHTLPDRFGPRSIRALARALAGYREPPTLLVQYVPQGFGCHGLNLPFLLWLASRRERQWVMFHEVVYPFIRGQPWKHHALAAGTRAMLAVTATRADRVLVSIPGWIPFLRRWTRLRVEPEWLPVPSNLPGTPTRPRSVVRAELGLGEEDQVLAYFGILPATVAGPLEAALDRLLGGRPERRLLLLGRNGADFKARAGHPQVVATGQVDAQAASNALAASDLGLFPFVDGASGRRTSLMAALALGVPVVTTEGALSEPIWRESEAVLLAPAGDAGALGARVDEALSSPAGLEALGARGKRLYDAEFSLDALLRRLLARA